MEWELVLDLVTQCSENMSGPDAQVGEDSRIGVPLGNTLAFGNNYIEAMHTYTDSLPNHKGTKKA